MPALNLEDAVQINIKEAQMNMGMITIAKIPSALIALVKLLWNTMLKVHHILLK